MPHLLVLLCAALLTLSCPSAASGAALLAPDGEVLTGVASGKDITDFQRRTGKHPDVWQHWIQWGDTFQYALRRSADTDTRLMLHVSTAAGQHQPGRLSPGQIARGAGDRWLVAVNRTLAEHDGPVYLRLLAEMNNCDLAYAPVGCDGRSRGADHSAATFKRAWRRTVLIVRGGPVATINRQLRGMKLRGVQGVSADERLPRPHVAVMWSPMTGGSPMIGALRPQRFWPGGEWVDWVGTSFYSRFPNFHFLEPYYQQFAVRHRKPFAFAEWAMWGADSSAFPSRLFSWARSHKRVRMMIYNQGHDPSGPFRLRRFPAAQKQIRRELNRPPFR